jgi:gluconolactonase
MYVADTRSSQYIHAIRLDAAGNMVGRSIFADLNEGSERGIPDELKVDSLGRVYCTGRGGIWVIAPDGRRIGVIRWPEQAVNFAFGEPDLRTLFLLRAHFGLHAADQGARQPASVVQAARAVKSRR